MRIWRYILGGLVGSAAYNRIGPSSYLTRITVHGTTSWHVIDCGLEPVPYTFDAREWYAVNLEELAAILHGERISTVLVTHAHLDHCGYLPALEPFLRDDAKIICTSVTKELIEYILHDVLMQSLARGGILGELPFQTLPLVRILQRLVAVDTPGVISLEKGIRVLLWPAGHINGACSFFFEISEGSVRRIVAYLGDSSVHRQTSVEGASLPPDQWLLKGRHDVIASLDCTNGGEEIALWEDERQRLLHDAMRVVKEGRRWIGITFSIVRAQSLAHELSLRKRQDSTLRNIPVYADGVSVRRISEVLKNFSWAGGRTLDLSDVEWIIGYRGRRSFMRNFESGWVLTPSGMGHGPAVDYFTRYLEDPATFIAFTGFVAQGTNGHRILNAQNGEIVRLGGNRGDEGGLALSVRAERAMYRFGAHQSRSEAIIRTLELFGIDSRSLVPGLRSDFSGNFQDLLPPGTDLSERQVGLTHGSTRALQWFEKSLAGIVKTARADQEDDRYREL
ncbi:MAG: MBL fold metallo-hydrolase [bacterium]|nr:MBL fold metallo-hydrolase [bacterium]MDZ4300005.1 MBL fold metallo-hydrolase [Candidatus Sungbacteria bacterium]